RSTPSTRVYGASSLNREKGGARGLTVRGAGIGGEVAGRNRQIDRRILRRIQRHVRPLARHFQLVVEHARRDHLVERSVRVRRVDAADHDRIRARELVRVRERRHLDRYRLAWLKASANQLELDRAARLAISRWDVSDDPRFWRILQRLRLRRNARDDLASAKSAREATDGGDGDTPLLAVARHDRRIERDIGQEHLQAGLLEALRHVRQVQRRTELAVGLLAVINGALRRGLRQTEEGPRLLLRLERGLGHRIEEVARQEARLGKQRHSPLSVVGEAETGL